MKFHILEILAICENNRDYCHTFRAFGFAALNEFFDSLANSND